MLVVAGGGEEQLTNTGAEFLGPHGATINVSIDDANFYTGTACFIYKGLAAGSSRDAPATEKGWWSYAAFFVQWDKGTHRSMWGLGSGEGLVRLGTTKGSSINEHKICLNTITGVYESAAEFSHGQWHRFKVEFDEGVWTVWASDNGAAFAEVLSQDDSGTYTELGSPCISINSTTDETGAAALWLRGDDIFFWDARGDNWNSRIGEQDFPRISEAHMPDTAGAKTESDAGQAAELDEIPPDLIFDSGGGINVTTTDTTLVDTTKAWVEDEHNGRVVFSNFQTMLITKTEADGITLTGAAWSGGGNPGNGKVYEIGTLAYDGDKDEYWTDVEDLKDVANGGDIPDTAVIQALMVTRVDQASDVGGAGPLYKFNVREGGVLYADSEEGIVQWGASVTDDWVNYAGYYPWTPAGFNWTQGRCEACQYGCSLVDGETDQLTVQAIYFGEAHEWAGPGVAARRIFIT